MVAKTSRDLVGFAFVSLPALQGFRGTATAPRFRDQGLGKGPRFPVSWMRVQEFQRVTLLAGSTCLKKIEKLTTLSGCAVGCTRRHWLPWPVLPITYHLTARSTFSQTLAKAGNRGIDIPCRASKCCEFGGTGRREGSRCEPSHLRRQFVRMALLCTTPIDDRRVSLGKRKPKKERQVLVYAIKRKPQRSRCPMTQTRP